MTVPTDSGSNAEPLARLDTFIERVRAMPVELVNAAAKDVAKLMHAELAANIAAGRAPDGTPWPPRKADGGKPLANAMNAIHVGVAAGPVVFAILAGPEALHNRGWVRGKVKRQIIPTELPASWATKIQTLLAQHFQRLAADGGGNAR